MPSLKLDLKGIHEFQQNRKPYLMIDAADEIIPGISAKGYKDLSWDDWWFKVHWPGDPNMPGMLQIESLVQLGVLTVLTLPGNKGKLAYLISADELKFLKKIKPGDRLSLNVDLVSWKRGIGVCSGIGKVGEVISDKLEIACSKNQSIKILEIQRQGKKSQKIGEFMLGSKIKKGSIIFNV